MLDGELTLSLGPQGEEVLVPARTLARVPSLVVHGFRNGSDAELRYLNLHAPGRGFADYMRGMRDGRTLSYDQEPPPADGGRPPTAAVVGESGVVAGGVLLLADIEEIAIAVASSDPGSPSAPPHLHRRHVESLYVLEGEIVLSARDRELRAEAGSWLQVPAGVRHSLSFPGSEPVRLLSLHAPSCGFGAFLRALEDAGDDQELAAGRAGFDQEP